MPLFTSLHLYNAILLLPGFYLKDLVTVDMEEGQKIINIGVSYTKHDLSFLIYQLTFSFQKWYA